MDKSGYENDEDIHLSYSTVVSTFQTGKTKDIAWRKWQLKQLWWLIEDNEQAILAAIKDDLSRPVEESYLTDLAGIRKDILYHLDHIDAWVADEWIGDSFISRQLGLAKVKKEPLGVVLIIGAWNFPILLVLQPLLAAITAGCCIMVKPSELTLACQYLLQELFQQYLDSTAIRLICADVPRMTKLLELPFNHIFFTGSASVGRKISAAAAIYLTPVTLELGGQSPAIICRSADVDRAAKNVAYAKFLNAGQVCLAVNHVFVDPEVHEMFLNRLQFWKNLFLNGESTIATAIISHHHWNHLFRLLHQTKGTIVCGGGGNGLSRQMEPTVVVDIDKDDALLSEEIFGPICPIIKMGTQQACDAINEKDHPLALYIFSSDNSEIKYILDHTISGGVTVNDVIIHASFPSAPFGGVGGSGHGYYHGSYGFKTFSHLRTIMSSPKWVDLLLEFRYPPYSAAKRAKIPQTKASFKRGESLHDQRQRPVSYKFATALAVCGAIFYWVLVKARERV